MKKFWAKIQPIRTEFVAYLLILAALAAAFAPSFLNAAEMILQIQRIGSYNDDMTSLDQEKTQAIWDAAEAYNKKIYQEQQKTVFFYSGDGENDEDYQSQLQVGDNGIMCDIEIPSLDIHLPVGHGTNSRLLTNSAGHMYGTSLPVGGNNTNAVIAGHTGLSNAKIFTDLDKMKEGDVFYIHVLDEVHTYTVEDIEVVLPEDETPYLQVVPDENLCTLYTCTPYGVNDHRLIIRGVFTKSEKEGSDGENGIIHMENIAQLIKTILIGSVPILYAIAGGIYLKKKYKKMMLAATAKGINTVAKTAEAAAKTAKAVIPDTAAVPDAVEPDNATETADQIKNTE